MRGWGGVEGEALFVESHGIGALKGMMAPEEFDLMTSFLVQIPWKNSTANDVTFLLFAEDCTYRDLMGVIR